MCRFLDESSEHVRLRTSLVGDYLRALRLLGRSNETAESLWRQMCLTTDPLMDPRGAVSQLRGYLDAVEAVLGPVPSDFPVASFQQQDDEDLTRRARRAWADGVMSATLDLGTSSGIVDNLEVHATSGVAVRGVSDAEEEPFVEPPPMDGGNRFDQARPSGTEANETNDTAGDRVEAATEAEDAEVEGLVSHQDANWNTTRAVRVVSARNEYGSFEVFVPDMTTGYGVMTQVVERLRQTHSVPPLPRWLTLGDDLLSDARIDPRDVFGEAVAPDEVVTVHCLDPGFGDSGKLEPDFGRAVAQCLSAQRCHGVLASGSLSDMPQRMVLIKANGQFVDRCCVAVPDLATPYTVFSQVSAFLAQSFAVPPLPRWLYVGDSIRTGLHLVLDALIIDQVLPKEELTVECLVPGSFVGVHESELLFASLAGMLALLLRQAFLHSLLIW